MDAVAPFLDTVSHGHRHRSPRGGHLFIPLGIIAVAILDANVRYRLGAGEKRIAHKSKPRDTRVALVLVAEWVKYALVRCGHDSASLIRVEGCGDQ